MKFFTKEWAARWEMAFHEPFVADEAAAERSDEYFEQIYAEQLAEYLELYADMPEEDVDEQDAKGQFEQLYSAGLDRMERILPQELRDGIADMRLAALGHLTAENIRKLSRFYDRNLKEVLKVQHAYDKRLKKLSRRLGKEKATSLDFGGRYIENIKPSEDSYIIEFDNGGRAIFEGYDIVCQEKNPRCSEWLYCELDFVDGCYEIGGLLLDEEEQLFEFTVRAKRVITEIRR